MSYCLKVSSLLQLIVLYMNGTLQLVVVMTTTTHYGFSNRDVPSYFQLKEWTVSRVSLAVITGTGIGIVEIIGLSHQNTTCETLGGYYVARSIGQHRMNRAL